MNNRNAIYDLPEDGLIYVDGSGISVYENKWGGSFIERKNNRVSFLSYFNNAIKKRGKGVSTVVSVLEEIEDDIGYYKSLMVRVRNNRNFNKRNIDGRRDLSICQGEGLFDINEENTLFHLGRRGKKEYGKLCATLEEGIEEYALPRDFDRRKEMSIVSKFDDYGFRSGKSLSSPDKDLVIEALASGEGNGIFSADKPMIEVYIAGVKELGLKGCFVCDSLQDRSYSV